MAPRARGMALLAVLWIVAALSIAVTGVVQSVRNEARVVSATRDLLTGGARASAAVALVLQSMQSQPQPGGRLQRERVVYDGQEIEVTVQPLNGLINVNSASTALLARLLLLGGGLEPAQANALAEQLAEARSTGGLRAMSGGFESAEDLLRVPGVDYELYAKIFPLITADLQGGGRVNPLSADVGVLTVLADGNVQRAARIAAQRDAGEPGIDTTGLVADFVDNTATPHFRLQARVPLGDGRWLLGTRWVTFRQGAPQGVPWQVFRAEDRFEAPRAQGN